MQKIDGFAFGTSLNQPPTLENYNLFASDSALREAVKANGGAWNDEQAEKFGALLGRAETLELGNLANKNTPVLKTHDRFGNRLDQVEFHPSYHALVRIGIENETHSLAWTSEQAGAYVARCALAFLKQQVDEGTSCPLTMTFAAVPSLKIEPQIAAEWLPRVLSNEYDERFVPATAKLGATFGMAMTEPQGGSDIRANITFARKIENGEYEITGRKWFCSAPMCDAFLVTAQTEKGISCFLLPRFRPDGTKNVFHIQRLKDKLGNKSNASSEVEFHQSYARIVGEVGRGTANIMEMVRHTRLDCAVGSAGTLRRAVAETLHHCAHRSAFGKLLIEQPLMKNVLADLVLESEAATAFAFRLARGFDESRAEDEAAKIFTRIATAIGKFWICKRAVVAVGEAMECLGGNGYVEESVLPRLYRDAPVNSIWEGSGNVQCLDVLRSMQKEPESVGVLLDEIKLASGANANFDFYVRNVERELLDADDLEFRARRVVERLALALQASILLRNAPAFVGDAFCNARLLENYSSFGTLPAEVDFVKIIARSLPETKI